MTYRRNLWAVFEQFVADRGIDLEAVVGREVLEIRRQTELLQQVFLFGGECHRSPFVACLQV